MLRIGEFSSLTNISISMLRNYDKIGLLIPEEIDDLTGYRYYSKSQILLANQIVALKEMGFGLDEIRELTQNNSIDLATMIERKKNEKLDEIKKIEEQIQRLNLATKIANNDKYALQVVTKTLPPMKVIGYKETIHSFFEEGKLWGKMNHYFSEQKLNDNPLSLSMSINNGFSEDNLIHANVELEVAKKIAINEEGFYYKEYSDRLIASITFRGPYAQISKINSFFASWLEENKYEVLGPSFSIYHTSPGDKVNENEFITELCFPIQPIL